MCVRELDKNQGIGSSIPYLDMTLFGTSFEFHLVRIVTHRINILELSVNGSGVFYIYDGPDVNCRRNRGFRRIGKVIFQTTTFQALLEAHIARYKLSVSSKGGEYIEMLLKNSTSNSKTIPWKSCHHTGHMYCVILLKGIRPMGINVTLLSLVYKGPSMVGDHCLYGGVIIYNRAAKGDLTQLLLECDNIDDSTFIISENMKSPSVFSLLGSSEIWVVGFSYSDYSMVDSIISISASSCKTLPVFPTNRKCNPNVKDVPNMYLAFEKDMFKCSAPSSYREHLISSRSAG